MRGGEATVYVYGVLAESDLAAVSKAGVAGSPVRTIAHAGVYPSTGRRVL